MYDANAISKEILETRNAELLAQNAALSSARARLAEAELDLEFTQVRAPISGRVSETRLDEGNLVSADSTLLATIEKSDVVQAYFEASERDLVRYAELGIFGAIDQKKLVGPEVELRLSSGSEKVFKGMATYFDNRIGDSTSSLTDARRHREPGRRLKAGDVREAPLESGGRARRASRARGRHRHRPCGQVRLCCRRRRESRVQGG